MNSNVQLIRALRGPLTLVLIGSLFALDHSTSIDFSKTWPVIIIFAGLIRLAERAFPKDPDQPPPYPQGGLR